jgi:anti-sigma B factor antagonist
MQPDAPHQPGIEVDYIEGTCVLTLPADASLEIADELRSLLRAAAGEGSTAVVVDLSRTSFVDSRTLGALLEGMKRLRPQGGQLRVVVGRREIRRVFEITLLDRAFALHPTRAEALATIAIAAPPKSVAAGAVPEEAA